MSDRTFLEILKEREPDWSFELCERVHRFRELVLDENQRQNLTRLTSPEDFHEGHVRDAVELVKSGFLEGKALDLGSGAGVPGILAALLEPREWVLVDSERRKAEFLERAIGELGLTQCESYWGRAEVYLRARGVETVVARAVGPVERIYGWLRECSTWNKLVLFKGPSWEEEWKGFQVSRHGKELKIDGKWEYGTGQGEKARSRVIIQLVRA